MNGLPTLRDDTGQTCREDDDEKVTRSFPIGDKRWTHNVKDEHTGDEKRQEEWRSRFLRRRTELEVIAHHLVSSVAVQKNVWISVTTKKKTLLEMTERVLADLKNGKNCIVEAVPGAGKTRLLLEASKQSDKCLILAYNAQLANDVSEQITYTTSCMTFHSLCCKCIGIARDDEQMLDLVVQAEEGTVSVTPMSDVDLLLLDEAQDVRSLYIRLVKICGLADVQKCVVGDRNQLVYDFDDSFPASLDTLLRCDRMFGGVWTRHQLNGSHRLTKPMANLVNAVFGTCIESEREGRPVEVRSAQNVFKLSTLLEDLIHDDLLILVDRKKGNRPLRALINDCSRRGIGVSVHGLDEESAEVHCGTFWSAKGVQAKTVVVLLPEAASRNPTYVALTRAYERLVVVLDSKEPHVAVCQAVVSLKDSSSPPILHDSFTEGVVSHARGDPSASLLRPERKTSAYAHLIGRNVDSFVPKRSLVKQEVETVTLDDFSEKRATETPCSSDLGAIAVRMALIRCENTTGVVRHVEDILTPTRLESEQVGESIRKGLVSRWISRSIAEASLLAPDLKKMVGAAYASRHSSEEWKVLAILALGCLAWDDFDHTMRKHVPVQASTFRALLEHIEWLDLILLPSEFQWDTRLVRKDTHCRVHATNAVCCLHMVWEATSSDEAAAALRASLHPNHECRLIELGPRTIRVLRTTACLED